MRLDSPHILIVEGNPPIANARVMEYGARPYGPAYADVLRALEPALQFTIVEPCVQGPDCLPEGVALSAFDGVAWTGSALNVYEDDPMITSQLRLAEKVFEAGLPVFGSCWGLQLCTTALGGKVRLNPKGREIGVAENITLTEAGAAHPMLAGRPAVFSALAAHRDEVEELPAGGVVLAGNPMSDVQAMTVEQGGVDFWGAQYHPELDHVTVAAIIRRTGDSLVREGVFPDRAAWEAAAGLLPSLDDPNATPPPGPYAAPEIRSVAARGLELANWLRTKVLRG